MKEFERFVEEGEVKKRTPNPSQAENLIQKSRKRLNYAGERPIESENSDLILEDSYEAIREALDAFLVLNGFKSYSHEASIVYGFEELGLSYDKVNRLNKFRKLRNDSKYRGEEVTVKEAEDCLKMAQELLPYLNEKFKENTK